MVVNGDITQIDLKDQESGLIEASRIFSGTEGIKFCYLTVEDVVRHPLVQKLSRLINNFIVWRSVP